MVIIKIEFLYSLIFNFSKILNLTPTSSYASNKINFGKFSLFMIFSCYSLINYVCFLLNKAPSIVLSKGNDTNIGTLIPG